jgi:hypothetical protein
MHKHKQNRAGYDLKSGNGARSVAPPTVAENANRFLIQFQAMSRNYLTPENHRSKAYHLHIGRQLTGNADSLKET